MLLGAVTVGGTTLLNQLSPGGGVLADTADFEPADLVVTTAPPSGAAGAPLTGHVRTGPAKKSHPATTTTTTTKPAAPTTTQHTTTTHPPTTTSNPPTSQTDQVFALVNQARATAGCKALTENADLDKAAQGHSDDMSTNNYFSHTTPAGVTFDKREIAAGYASPGGENIAAGQTSAQQVMTDWMNSSGHRANILNCQFTAIGIGLATKGWYWTQDFGY
ncbi:MAG TPA: CAP domain-containing protein [Pseudonocardiaceae bacterium]|nr:CAP domain-containing protein [Pseudonocardiaceae bacterium]